MAARSIWRSSAAGSSSSTTARREAAPRRGIVSTDSGQSEAGLALGMTPNQTMRRIVLPQAIKRMIPALMNQSIIQFKNTSLVSVLAVPDLGYHSPDTAH